MVNPEGYKKGGKRSKGRKATRGQRTINIGTTTTVNKDNTNTRDNTKTTTNETRNGGGGGFARLDREGMEKIPSNAPTMAIAPSDYEHIFHEATGVVGGGGGQRETPPNKSASPSPPVRTFQASPPPQPGIPPTVPTLPPPPMPIPRVSRAPPQQTVDQTRDQSDSFTPLQGRQGNEPPLIVTPDGYNILGRPTETDQRKAPLPPYIVRASNQFSRAALARVAKYLASRADPPR